jgi:hypothetical protein
VIYTIETHSKRHGRIHEHSCLVPFKMIPQTEVSFRRPNQAKGIIVERQSFIKYQVP